jgi:1,4-dihydroxy-2-naphthoate octaprenyltransferase
MKHWIQAMRLRTLPLAASGIVCGSALAWSYQPQPWLIFMLCLLTAFSLQVLSNLANDYGDYVAGADNAGRIGPARAVQSGAIRPEAMRRGIIITAIIALAAGLLLLWFACFSAGRTATGCAFLAVGLCSIAAAIRYTAGNNPYGYRGLGDLAVLLFFGGAAVAGTSLMYTAAFRLEWILPALAIGLFSVGVLNLNNMRDRENDGRSGKITVAVRLGKVRAKYYHLLLLTIGWLCLIIFALGRQHNYLWFALLAPAVLMSIHLRFVFRNTEDRQLDGELKKLALSTLLVAVILFLIR